ncbi:cellulase family glycosylhydrolase [Fusibacter bizertensis]
MKNATVKNAKLIVMTSLILVLMMSLLTGCNESATNNALAKTSDTSAPVTEAIETTSLPEVEEIVATKIQNKSPEYVPIQDVGSYNSEIITPELLSDYQLPDASKNNVPYWTGFILENKISVNYSNSEWSSYTAGNTYFVEDEIKYFHENGFNCARAVYSLSFFSNPDDIAQVNLSELEQLDELISWGLKYDVHIMVSITGLPGKWHTSWEEEGVQSNNELFADEAMQETFHAYWKMLSKRYAQIPTNVLSFEILAEPEVVNGDTHLYASVLKPIVEDLWQDNPERILIVSDVGKQIPEELAAIGCDLSMHTHIYTVSEERLDNWGIKFDATWPMQYLPGSWNTESGKLVLESDDGFSEGEITVYYDYYNTAAKILADDKTIYKPKSGEFLYDKPTTSAVIPEGTKKITIVPQDEAFFVALSIVQKDKETITIPTHSLYGVYVPNELLPTIKINTDGTLKNMDQPESVLDSVYFTNAYLKGFIDCADKYGVSFLMTEVGTDTIDLTPDQYVAYHSEWLKALKENHISWMYNCTHNILAPEPLMWLNGQNSMFTEFADTSIPKYKENVSVMEMLKSFE